MLESDPHILVVDDDTRLRELLKNYLTENRFRVTTAEDAADARTKLEGMAFDLIVLDVMMPGEDGMTFTKSLRRTSDVPILMLTAMGEPHDRIGGLERGADDYMVKPFEPRELVLRIRTILRWAAQRIAEAPPDSVTLGDCTYNVERAELRRDGALVRLTETETALLATLARNPGVTLSRQDLIDLGRLGGNSRAVDVQVARLRRKIESNPRDPRYLHTVRGKGYLLRPD